MPCGEKTRKDQCCKVNTTKQDSKKSEPTHDACSPFCVGSCCAPHIIIKDFQPPVIETADITTVYTEYGNTDLPEIAIPIWQPPKLSFIS
ncbi:MAG: hypothetical protein JNJ40_12675 [Bacteroidia bacterium]|nr:hypothetical protein [Bacteroidia bacterium]